GKLDQKNHILFLYTTWNRDKHRLKSFSTQDCVRVYAETVSLSHTHSHTHTHTHTLSLSYFSTYSAGALMMVFYLNSARRHAGKQDTPVSLRGLNSNETLF